MNCRVNGAENQISNTKEYCKKLSQSSLESIYYLLPLHFFSKLLFTPFQNHLSHSTLNWNYLSSCINSQLYFNMEGNEFALV